MNSILIVTTSLPNIEVANNLALRLIEHRMAACIHIQEGVQSIYRWEGKICRDNEVLLIAKTSSANWQAIEAFIKEHHPYQLPEIIGLAPAHFSQAYGIWVSEEVRCD
jgi:periplasmic divalent cation tolerance protein